MGERRYDDQEVARIIQRAAEVQAGTLPGGESGVTLTDIQKVASEIGIDPSAVETAAREVTGSLEPSPARAGFSPFCHDGTFEGEMTDELWDECVSGFRQVSGQAGQVTMSSRRFEWTGAWDTAGMTVTANVRDGRTRVRVVGQINNGIAVIWTLGIAFGFLAALIALLVMSKQHMPAVATALVVSGVVAAFGLASHGIQTIFARKSAARFLVVMRLVGDLLSSQRRALQDQASVESEAPMQERLTT